MINSHYRWVIVAAGGLLACVAIGAMSSLPVFLLPIAQDTGWSVTGVSSVPAHDEGGAGGGGGVMIALFAEASGGDGG